MRLRCFSQMVGTLALAAMLASCSDDSKPGVRYDKGQQDMTVVPDGPTTVPDLPQPDVVWPDYGKRDKPVYPDMPRTDYSTGAFGCQVDTDCFGQKCCPTPWGVKLCAPACDIK